MSMEPEIAAVEESRERVWMLFPMQCRASSARGKKKKLVYTEDDAVALSLSHLGRPGFTYIVRGSKLPVIVGNGHASYIRLVDDSISDRHCLIDRKGDNWTVCDLMTESGTYVNGNRITETVLMTGDQLKLGRTTLRVHIDSQVRPRDPCSPGRGDSAPGTFEGSLRYLLAALREARCVEE